MWRGGKSLAAHFGTDVTLATSVGLLYKTCTTPWEHLKGRLPTLTMQLEGESNKSPSVLRCYCRMLRTDGFSCWKGNARIALLFAPRQGSALAFNDCTHNFLCSQTSFSPSTTPLGVPERATVVMWLEELSFKLAIGSLAGGLALTLTHPFQVASDRRTFRDQLKLLRPGRWTFPFPHVFLGWRLAVLAGMVRGCQMGFFKHFQETLNPYRRDTGLVGLLSTCMSINVAWLIISLFHHPMAKVSSQRYTAMLLHEQLLVEKTSGFGLVEKKNKGRPSGSPLNAIGSVIKNEGLRNLLTRGWWSHYRAGVGGTLVIIGYERVKVIGGF